MAARSGEFELIARHFAPIAQSDPAALSLQDDAAVFSPPAGHEVVVTTDALVADVHFRSIDDPDLIAKKVLRVNLSDLAAMGAKPGGVVLSAGYNRDLSDEWVEQFAKGFGQDCKSFGVSLWGGDTVVTPGPTFFSLTAFGYVPAGRALRRDMAKPGDVLAVTGTLGDAALGLAVLNDEFPDLDKDLAAYLQDRYLLPKPRLDESAVCAAANIRLAAMDVSDGLAGDCRKICAASNVGLVINRDAIPLSDAAKSIVDVDESQWERVLAGGDDYELLIAGSPDDIAALGDMVTVIGGVTDEVGTVSLVGVDGKMAELADSGFDHFK
ncbi:MULTISPECIES: thiamine-phosphate kinase [Thalassospira]|uniref:Thiamine-monophosphate kinase n=1 Tax=Thalassospira profundimaris TaxID=502049 RepID=A0A367V5S3_9PROT|nr:MULTISPECIES: thiamine-phosphate kinase [Thalassospira]KZB73119.1 thiamine-monophosphate kinase [Thalassospira sp. MCCC 1A01148]RCK20558.1 thiamine-monophosphate kinase [Thalassospira profundimaris]